MREIAGQRLKNGRVLGINTVITQYTKNRERQFNLGQILPHKLHALSDQTSPESWTHSPHLDSLLMTSDIRYGAILLYLSSYQFLSDQAEVRKIEDQHLGGEQNSRKFTFNEKRAIETTKSNYPLVEYSVPSEIQEHLTIIERLSKLPLPLSADAQKDIASLFHAPTSFYETEFLLGLMDMTLWGKDILASRIESKGFSHEICQTFRKAAERVNQFFWNEFFTYTETRFDWQKGNNNSHPEHVSSDPFFKRLIALYFSMEISYILPSNFAQLLSSDFIPGLEDDFIQRVITMQRESFEKKYPRILGKKDSKGRTVYAMVEQSYTNGESQEFFETLIEDVSEIPQTTSAQTDLTQLLQAYDKLYLFEKRKGPIIIDVYDIPSIESIDIIGGERDNFIDIIVFSHDGKALGLQFDRGGRLIGFPDPHNEGTEKAIAQIVKYLVGFCLEQGFIKNPERKVQTRRNQPIQTAVPTRLVDTKPTDPEQKLTHEQRKALYEAVRPIQASDKTTTGERTRICENGKQPHMPQQPERSSKGFRLKFPEEYAKELQTGRHPEYELLTREALEKVRQDIAVNRRSPKLERVKTKPGCWKINWAVKSGEYRIFLHEDGQGNLLVDHVEDHTDNTYGKEFIRR